MPQGSSFSTHPLSVARRPSVQPGVCASAVTAEHKLNRSGYRYVYYHCCRRNRRYDYCAESSLEEDRFEEQFYSFLESLYLPQDLLELMLEELPRLYATRQKSQWQDEHRLKELIARNHAQLRHLRELCADGHISPEEYDEDRERYFVQKQHIKEQLAAAQDNTRLIELVSSNLLLKDRSLLIQTMEPFETYRNVGGIDYLRRALDNVRTCLLEIVYTKQRSAFRIVRSW